MPDADWRPGEIIELPHIDMRRLNLLLAEIQRDLADGFDRVSGAGFLLLEIAGGRLNVDNHAFIDSFLGDDDLYCVFQTQDGPQLPLVTRDIRMMARFVCAYIFARIDHPDDGRPHLSARGPFDGR